MLGTGGTQGVVSWLLEGPGGPSQGLGLDRLLETPITRVCVNEVVSTSSWSGAVASGVPMSRCQ